VFRSKAEQKVAEAGYDPARLPPGQYLTEKWPVLHAGGIPETDLASWDFKVFGEVENPLTLTWEQLQELPSTEITIDIHCVTRWSRFDTSFRGVHWRDLAELVKPKPSARFVIAHAEQGFTSNVPLEALEDEQAMIAYEADGEPLEPSTAGHCASSFRAATSGRAPSGSGGSSSSTTTSPDSGSATATTTMPITGVRSGIASKQESKR
jgi:DMSO/TMAO reductase YedYZ molybdopterin-dependent catalytic subunit